GAARRGVVAQCAHAERAGANASRASGEHASASRAGGNRASPNRASGRRAIMTALAVNGLIKAFGGLRVTRNVTLNVEPGERRLIIGPNGAGKTTLFNLITGEIAPDKGSIALFGHDVTRTPSHRRAHLGMARTYQIITLFPLDTIVRNVTLALLGLSKLRWNPFIDVDQQHDLIERARAALVRVGLDHIAHRPLSEPSYGEGRRSPCRGRRSRRSCSWTSRSPACPSTSGATSTTSSRRSRAT